jgi:hypothetical protein
MSLCVCKNPTTETYQNMKLFVFGIGGTGARVIKSLTMLLAAGVKAGHATEIVPIMVDPHQNNKDLNRTIQLLDNYQAIHGALHHPQDGFFKTKIKTLEELNKDNNLQRTFAFNMQGVQNERFKQYIDYATLDDANKALAGLLFSDKNLETEMEIGFVGNPNIGSVVLNQFKESDEFAAFASNFEQNDRIFIVSSIFGGTGAAGFPLILKNIRNAQPPTQNHAFLNNAKIGAVTVQPYFGVSPGSGQIDKATFITKTKAALNYYEKNVSGNQSVNALYYIGDEVTRDYNNDPGQNGQQNDAHFIELAAALSIIDFASFSDGELEVKNGRAVKPVYREFGIREDNQNLNFLMLSDVTQQIIKKKLSQYVFAMQYLKRELVSSIASRQPFAMRDAPKIDSSFTSNNLYRNNVVDFNKLFEEWLREMSTNRRSFAPFDLNTLQYAELISGIKTKKGFGFWASSKEISVDTFNDALNRAEKGKIFPDAMRKLMAILYEGTELLLNENYDDFK